MSSAFLIKNVQSFIERLRSRDHTAKASHLDGARVSPDARSLPTFISPPRNQAEIRLRSDTVGAARRLASTKARNELI